MYKLLLLIIIISFNLSGQTLLNIYKNIIPAVCLDSDDKRTNVSAMLENLSVKDPYLLYYYIEYLKVLSDKSFDTRVAKQYLDYQSNEYLKRLEPWVNNEFDIIFDKNISHGQWLQLWFFYYSINDSPDNSIVKIDPNFVIDNNYRNYVVYLFYSNSFSQYYPSTDYSGKISEIITPVISELMYAYNNTDQLNDEFLDHYYDTAIKNPFFFKGTPCAFVQEPAPVCLAEYLIKVSTPRFEEKNTLTAAVGLSFFKNMEEEQFTFADDPDISATTRLWGLNQSGINIGLNGILQIREHKTYLSNINFYAGIGYSNWGSDGEIKLDQGAWYILRLNDYGNRVNPNYSLNNINLSTISYFARVTTPLIYFSSGFNLEIGAVARHSIYSYSFTVKRDDKYLTQWSVFSDDLLTKYDKEMEFSRTLTKVFPLISLNYAFSDNMGIKFYGSTESFIPQLEFFYRLF
jgi:hypothetical protein